MKKDAASIKDVAKDIIKNLSKERHSKEDRIKEAWEKAAGKKFCAHAQPVSFRKKRLVVNVDSSGWLYELTMRKQKIVSRLRKMLKDDFRELQFRIGRIEK
jgi:predicted nucleic acid-binding Zn ribbon protein